MAERPSKNPSATRWDARSFSRPSSVADNSDKLPGHRARPEPSSNAPPVQALSFAPGPTPPRQPLTCQTTSPHAPLRRGPHRSRPSRSCARPRRQLMTATNQTSRFQPRPGLGPGLRPFTLTMTPATAGAGLPRISAAPIRCFCARRPRRTAPTRTYDVTPSRSPRRRRSSHSGPKPRVGWSATRNCAVDPLIRLGRMDGRGGAVAKPGARALRGGARRTSTCARIEPATKLTQRIPRGRGQPISTRRVHTRRRRGQPPTQ